MTKTQFLCCRKQGYTIEFVNYGEDIKAKIGGYSSDATFKKGGHSYASKKIKVKMVDYGEDVKLSETSSYSADCAAV